MKTPMVFVIDDDDAVRSAVRLLLKSVGLPATAFSSAQEFLPKYAADQPGCLVIDVRMPGMSGLELQQQLNLMGATIPVIFITGHGDIPMAVEAIQHGAFDFLPKPFRDQDLIDRVQRALQQDADSRRDLARGEVTRARIATLTPREREVLDLLVTGKFNKVMAHELGVSQRTVEIHRSRVMEKMHADSVAHLVRMTMELERSSGPS